MAEYDRLAVELRDGEIQHVAAGRDRVRLAELPSELPPPRRRGQTVQEGPQAIPDGE